MLDQSAERIFLGHVTGVSGLKGLVKVHSDTNPRENIIAFKQWWIEQGGAWRQINVVNGRPQGKTIVAQIEGVSSPEQASLLIGAKIAVDRETLPQLSGGEYYWTDLVGMQVKTVDGVELGPVDRLFETGANDVVVIKDERDHEEKSSSEVLVPWLVPDVITEVNMDSRVITVDWDPDF